MKTRDELLKDVRNARENLFGDPETLVIKMQQFQNATSQLDTIDHASFLHKKKTGMVAVIDHVLVALRRSGDLISRNQSINHEEGFLSMVWDDITYSSMTEGGHRKSSILLNTKRDNAETNLIKSEKIIIFLEDLRTNILQCNKYSSLMNLLYQNQNPFLDLNK